MKKGRFVERGIWLFLLACGILTVGILDTAFTQDNEPDASQKYRIRIRKIYGTGSAGTVKTPLYSTSVPRSTGAPDEWGQITVEYDVAVANRNDPWINELLFEYFVITDKGNNQLSFFKKSVRYADVKEGQGHMSRVYLRPAAIERFGKVVAAAVEISAEGKVLAEDSDVTMKQLKSVPKWWRVKEVVDSEMLSKRGEGYLINRMESPFAYINVDDFEVIKE